MPSAGNFLPLDGSFLPSVGSRPVSRLNFAASRGNDFPSRPQNISLTLINIHTMALQKVFTPGYIQHLKSNIKVENYLGEAFPYDSKYTRQLAGVQHPEDLLKKLIPDKNHDLETALAIFEAYPNLSPVFAQQDGLWTYLTHVDLFPYVQERWNIKELDPEEQLNMIEHHWFRDKFQFLRTSFAGFWWNVRLTVDNDRKDKYELTRYLFKNAEFRTSSFGELPLIRHSEAMKGIIEFVRDNEEVFSNGFNAKARYIRHAFNIIGGYKNIAALPKEFFYDYLESKLEIIKQTTDAAEVKAGADIYNK